MSKLRLIAHRRVNKLGDHNLSALVVSSISTYWQTISTELIDSVFPLCTTDFFILFFLWITFSSPTFRIKTGYVHYNRTRFSSFSLKNLERHVKLRLRNWVNQVALVWHMKKKKKSQCILTDHGEGARTSPITTKMNMQLHLARQFQ